MSPVLNVMSELAWIERSRLSPSRTASGMRVTTKRVTEPKAGIDTLSGEKSRVPPEAVLEPTDTLSGPAGSSTPFPFVSRQSFGAPSSASSCACVPGPPGFLVNRIDWSVTGRRFECEMVTVKQFAFALPGCRVWNVCEPVAENVTA